MKMADIIALANDCGFDNAAPLDIKTLKFMPEVQEMCAADRCHSYNRNWSCPPATGTLEDLRNRCTSYQYGILVQTVGTREDEFDFETISTTLKRHEETFTKLAKTLKANLPDLMPMGIGACQKCEKCTWPDAPCRFPEDVFPPMEACGLLVSQICKDNNVQYYYGKDGISFTSCFLFNL